MPISIAHYLNNLSKLTNQWNEYNYQEPQRQRVYLKDIDCPPVWHEKLKEKMPPGVFYLNDSTGQIGGPGSIAEKGNRKGRGIARSGDLMSCLPAPMRAENLMCYIGHEGTYTPAHREMCASLGQNIMVETSGSVDDDGQPTKPGSSIWFMTETKDRHTVSEYWLSILGHDIEVEKHFAQLNAWKAAPFTVYVVEQKLGDFILIPPLAPHQVWNRGTRTMKVAWNRTTVETLEMALHEALPRARMVCRDEQYKNKAIVLFSLQHYSTLLVQVERQVSRIIEQAAKVELLYSGKIRQMQKDFKRLFKLFTEILLSETLYPVAPGENKGQYLPFDGCVTCSYCRCNIFNRFLTCTSCVVPLENGDEDTYDICMDCFVMGRSCYCLSKFKWVEQFPWKDLLEKHDLWRRQILKFEGNSSENTVRSLQMEVKMLKKKTLAQVCQEQLKVRPYHDPKKPAVIEEPEMISEEDGVNVDGTLKKKKKARRSEKWLKDHTPCHMCKDREDNWKLAFCSCGQAWCYGSLWRAFDIMPQSVMENPDWKCPRCLKNCPCRNCIKDPGNQPFQPKGTVLGHDTKKIADPRSVESLVDFSHSNMHWVKKAGDDHPTESRRLYRRLQEAAEEKRQGVSLGEHYVEDGQDGEHGQSQRVSYASGRLRGEIPIDPLLSITYDRVPATENGSGNDVDGGDISDESSGEGSTENGHGKRQRLNESPEHTQQMMASQALQALNGLSRLEQDPAAFLQHVQENTREDEQRRTLNASAQVAPTAILGNSGPSLPLTDHHLTADDYEYPDPEESPTAPQYSNGTSTQPQEDNQSKIILVSRKRKRDKPDLVPQNDANRKFQQLQLQKTMAEAKRKGRYISAAAAVSGKALVMKFCVPTHYLAWLKNEPVSLAQNSPVQRRPDQERLIHNIEPDILESDLPPQIDPALKNTSKGPKRKWVREEIDEDFTTAPSRTQKTKSKTALKPIILEDDDEADAIGEDDDEFTHFDSHQPKRRSLPAYLARKHDGDESMPSELPNPVPVRKPKRPQALDPRHSLPASNSSRPRPITKPRVADARPKSSSEVRTVSRSSPILDEFGGEVIPGAPVELDISTFGPGEREVDAEDTGIILFSTFAQGAKDLAEEGQVEEDVDMGDADALPDFDEGGNDLDEGSDNPDEGNRQTITEPVIPAKTPVVSVPTIEAVNDSLLRVEQESPSSAPQPSEPPSEPPSEEEVEALPTPQPTRKASESISKLTVASSRPPPARSTSPADSSASSPPPTKLPTQKKPTTPVVSANILAKMRAMNAAQSASFAGSGTEDNDDSAIESDGSVFAPKVQIAEELDITPPRGKNSRQGRKISPAKTGINVKTKLMRSLSDSPSEGSSDSSESESDSESEIGGPAATTGRKPTVASTTAAPVALTSVRDAPRQTVKRGRGRPRKCEGTPERPLPAAVSVQIGSVRGRPSGRGR